jgi:hypothetical protein
MNLSKIRIDKSIVVCGFSLRNRTESIDGNSITLSSYRVANISIYIDVYYIINRKDKLSCWSWSKDSVGATKSS